MIEQIRNGKALNKFKQLIKNQGGDTSYVDFTEKFEKAKYIIPVVANKSGYVQTLDAKNIGEISVNLGAGRIKKDDQIDKAVGIVLKKKIGDKVENKEILAYIHANDEEKGKKAMQDLLENYHITQEKVAKQSAILKII